MKIWQEWLLWWSAESRGWWPGFPDGSLAFQTGKYVWKSSLSKNSNTVRPGFEIFVIFAAFCSMRTRKSSCFPLLNLQCLASPARLGFKCRRAPRICHWSKCYKCVEFVQGSVPRIFIKRLGSFKKSCTIWPQSVPFWPSWPLWPCSFDGFWWVLPKCFLFPDSNHLSLRKIQPRCLKPIRPFVCRSVVHPSQRSLFHSFQAS